ncbi:hypothetical protein Tco_0314316, partial [Tanacetum coccineum]
ERESGDRTESVAELNLRTIGALRRFVISSDSSHHFGTNVVEAEKLVEPSLFCTGSSLAGGTDSTMGGFSDLTSSDFLVGAICTVIDPDTDL